MNFQASLSPGVEGPAVYWVTWLVTGLLLHSGGPLSPEQTLFLPTLFLREK